MKNTLFTLFIAMLLVSCDPVHYLNFRNFTQKEVVVTIRLKPDADKELYGYLKNMHSIEGDSIVLYISKKGCESLFFGFGNWGDEGVTYLAASMESLEIDTSEIKTVYKTPAAIEALLLENLKGVWFKSEIEIDIK